MSRQVLLDDERYDIAGDIHRRNINPRAPRFDIGTPGYAAFTQANVEAWKGMRGGIGHKYQERGNTEECYWSEGLDGSHHGGIILGPKVTTAGTFGAAPVDIIDFEGSTYAIGASKISKWNTGTSAWDSKETGIASPLSAIVVTDSTDTYLVVSDATSAKYTTDGTSWSALAGCKGYLAVFDNRLFGFYGQTVNYSPAKNIDGTWATWDVAAYLGTVHRLFTAKSQTTDEPLLCLATTEGTWTLDPWVQQIYPLLKLTGHTNAGRTGMFWNSYIWVATGPGIKKISPGIVTDVGPDQEDGLPSGYQGAVYDMEGMADGSWMVYCVNGGSTDKSSIIKRHGTVGGNQQVYTTSAINNAIACVHYSPSSLYTNGRLWWGEATGIKYCMMPDLNADVTEISGYDFVATSGKMIYSIFRPLEGINKLAIRVRAVTKGCAAAKKITVNYWSDNDADWQSLGEFITSPNPTALPFASEAGLVFRWIKFGIEMVTNACYEYYNTGDDASSAAYGTQWVAQTFTPSIGHKITSVKLKLWRGGNVGLPGTVTISIKATDGSGHPTGADLCSGTIDGDTLTLDVLGEWHEITLGAGYNLVANTKYAIVARAPDGDSDNICYWRDDNGSSYAEGNHEESYDSGSTWTTLAGSDQMFEEWGPQTGTATPELRSLELDYDAAAKRIRGWTFVVPVTQHNAEATITKLHTTQDKDTLVLFYPSGDSDKTSYRVKITNLAENIHWDASQTEGQAQVSVEELLRG